MTHQGSQVSHGLSLSGPPKRTPPPKQNLWVFLLEPPDPTQIGEIGVCPFRSFVSVAGFVHQIPFGFVEPSNWWISRGEVNWILYTSPLSQVLQPQLCEAVDINPILWQGLES